VNTGPQEFLGTTQSAERLTKEFFKMYQITRDTVGNISFELSPDEFIGIEFWSVTREKVSVNSGVTLQETLNKM
jgi:hypothetical protein